MEFNRILLTFFQVYFGSGLKNIADLMVGNVSQHDEEASRFFFGI